jgi:hypothetical protein
LKPLGGDSVLLRFCHYGMVKVRALHKGLFLNCKPFSLPGDLKMARISWSISYLGIFMVALESLDSSSTGASSSS